MTANQKRVLQAIKRGYLTAEEIARDTGFTVRSVRMHLMNLRGAQFIVGDDGTYRLTNTGEGQLPRYLSTPTPNDEPEPQPTQDEPPMELSNRASIALVAIAILTLALIVMVATGIHVVNPGQVGIKTSMGTLDEQAYPNDWYFTWPWESMTIANVQEFSLSVQRDAHHSEAAVTFDKQALGYSVHVSAKYNDAQVWMLYRHFGRDPEAWHNAIVAPILPHAFKTVSSQRTLDEAIANRTELSADTAAMLSELLREKLVAKDPQLDGAIVINQVTVPNLDYSAEYQQVIEATQRVQEEIRQQRNQLVRYMVEQAQSVVAAEAEQQAAVARATGAALAKIIEFEAELTRVANLVQLGVDPNQIYTWDRLAEISEKWDGALPRFLNGTGEGMLPMRMPMDVAAGDREITEKNIEVMLDGVRQRRGELEETLRELRAEQRQLREDLMTATERPGAALDDLVPQELRDAMGESQTQPSDETEAIDGADESGE